MPEACRALAVALAQGCQPVAGRPDLPPPRLDLLRGRGAARRDRALGPRCLQRKGTDLQAHTCRTPRKSQVRHAPGRIRITRHLARAPASCSARVARGSSRRGTGPAAANGLTGQHASPNSGPYFRRSCRIQTRGRGNCTARDACDQRCPSLASPGLGFSSFPRSRYLPFHGSGADSQRGSAIMGYGASEN